MERKILTQAKLASTVEKGLFTYTSCKQFVAIRPYSQVFDQQTLTYMIEPESAVQRYRALFALFNWTVVPEPSLDPPLPASDLTRNVPTSRRSYSSWKRSLPLVPACAVSC